MRHKELFMEPHQKKIVIIGAGPTGLGAAYRLKELGYTNFMVYDRLPHIGGLASSFTDSVHDHRNVLARMRRIEFDFGRRGVSAPLRREIERFPYVPSDPQRRNERTRNSFPNRCTRASVDRCYALRDFFGY